MLFNVFMPGIKFQGEGNIAISKKERKLVEAICQYFVFFCKLEASRSLFYKNTAFPYFIQEYLGLYAQIVSAGFEGL